MKTVAFIIAGWLAVVAQTFLPEIPLVMARILPVVLVAVFAAMRLEPAWAFLVAALCGVPLDLLTHQILGSGTASLCVTVGVVLFQRFAFEVENILTVIIWTALAGFAFVFTDYLYFSWQAGQWQWPWLLWSKMVFTAVLNCIVAPYVFAMADVALEIFHPADEPRKKEGYAL